MLDEKCLELESTVLVCNEDRVRTRNDAMMEKNRERTMKLNGLCYETDGDE